MFSSYLFTEYLFVMIDFTQLPVGPIVCCIILQVVIFGEVFV